MALRPTDYKTGVHNDWCPGCGDFGILSSLQTALAEMELEPHRVAVLSGIGCSGKTPHYVNAYGIHTLHGRLLPFAVGAKLCNPGLEVFGVAGDGDGLGIGVGHFVNAGRRNVDLTYIVHDNGVYGLTKGQASPTLGLGVRTKALAKPNINERVNPLLLAFAAGYTFIARGYAYDVKHLKELFKAGARHRGLAFIDVLQPCPTYNNINTKEWYAGEDLADPASGKAVPRVYKLEDEGYDPVARKPGDPEEMSRKVSQFMRKVGEWGDRIPLGVFYQNETIPTYEDRIAERIPVFKSAPPAEQAIATTNGGSLIDLDSLLEEFRVT